MKYCVKCGREVSVEDFISTYSLCIDCYLKHRGIFKNKPILELTMCPRCNRWRIGNEWIDVSLDEVIRRCFLDNVNKFIEQNVLVIDMSTRGESEKIYRNRYRVSVSISILINDRVDRVIDTELEYVLVRKICPKCIAVSGKIHRVLVQIRSENGVIDSVVKSILEKLLSEPAVSEDIVDLSENKYGFDLKFYSINIARKFVNDFVKNTGAKVIESFKPTRYDSRKGRWRGVYTVSLRIPSIKVGDLAEYRGGIVIVRSVESNRIIVENLENHALISIDYDTYWSGLLKKVDNISYYKKYTVVGFDKTTIYLVSDDGEFREIRRSEETRDINNGDTVYIVVYNNREYLVRR